MAWNTGSQLSFDAAGAGFQSLGAVHLSTSAPFSQCRRWMLQLSVCQTGQPLNVPLLKTWKTSSPSTRGAWKCTRRSPSVAACSFGTNGSYSTSASTRMSGCAVAATWPLCPASCANCGQPAKTGSAATRRTKARRVTRALRGQCQIAERLVLARVDLRVICQPHDLEGLVDDGGEAAEADLAALVHHLLDDLDEDGDADGVDDLGLAEVEQERAHAGGHE